jgi:hypothetical protein
MGKQYGLTPLMYAVVQDPGHDRLVRALLKAGVLVAAAR